MLSLLENESNSLPDEPAWPFNQIRSTVVLTNKQVMLGRRAVLQVEHHADFCSWAFTCGTADDEADALFVQMEQLISRDRSLFGIADLPAGWHAWRESIHAPWQRRPAKDQHVAHV